MKGKKMETKPDARIVGPTGNSSLIKQFMDAGIVPENCQRIVLDLRHDAIAKLYYECLADTRILEIDIPSHIGPEIKIIDTKGESNGN